MKSLGYYFSVKICVDYIRDDWAMREYRAIINVERIEKMIGTRAIAFSAYYYEGHSRPRAVDVP